MLEGRISDPKAVDILRKMAQLSRQLIDSLPVENKAWTKARI